LNVGLLILGLVIELFIELGSIDSSKSIFIVPNEFEFIDNVNNCEQSDK